MQQQLPKYPNYGMKSTDKYHMEITDEFQRKLKLHFVREDNNVFRSALVLSITDRNKTLHFTLYSGIAGFLCKWLLHRAIEMNFTE